MAAQLGDGGFPRHRLAVRALVFLGRAAHHGIESVHDGDDAGLDRDLVFLQAVRVALAVGPLVMVAYPVADPIHHAHLDD